MDSPVTCMVQNVSVKHGKSQCLWSSCREGCTSDMYQCYQVRVAYADVKYKNNTFVNDFRTDDWADLTRFDALENQVSARAVHVNKIARATADNINKRPISHLLFNR